jgi:uncharacterized damage-inducible protein DinB
MKTLPSKTDPAIAALLMLLDEAYNKPAWHGPNLRGAVRRLSAEQAAWRPASGRKNIWELVVHAAYWKYTVLRQLTGQKRGSFPLAGSNWFPREEAEEPAWRSDVKLLDRMHADLRAAVAALAPDKLNTKPPGSKHTYRRLIQGAALHDVYHAGQIQTLKRLMSAAEVNGTES